MYRHSLFLFICLIPILGSAQDGAGWVRVVSSATDAFVVVDGTVLGRVADGPIAIEGEIVLELVEANTEAWRPRRQSVSVQTIPGDTLDVGIELPILYRIESFPVGAEVIRVQDGERRSLGETPLVVSNDEPMEGHLIVSLPGYFPGEIVPGQASVNRHDVLLRPVEERAQVEASSGWSPPRHSTAWMDYAAAGIALASAGVAVYYKFEADTIDDLYREPSSLRRGDPALKAEAERLDTYSLAALAAMQASLGFIAVRFVLK